MYSSSLPRACHDRQHALYPAPIKATQQSPAYTEMARVYEKKTADNTEKILKCAKKLEEAGAFAVVLELIPAESAEYITKNLNIPTIGIGGGKNCSGQIVVTDDILGKFTDFTPKFIKKFANIHDTVLLGVENYKREVKEGLFPSDKEAFELSESEREKLNVIK